MLIFIKKISVGILFLLLWGGSGNMAAVQGQEVAVPVLCYHDIHDDGTDLSVSPQNLKAHFEYLRQMHYTPISLQQYKAALQGKAQLPPNPILLSFDDGYQSFYTVVYPLLQEYEYPAMFAVITSWINDPGHLAVTSQELQEMDESPLVTMASHTFQLHDVQLVDVSGKKQPITAGYAPLVNGKYQSKALYRQKVAQDMESSQNQLHEILGHKVDAIVWPYGAYTEENIDLAFEHGYKISFILGSFPNKISDHDFRHIRRAAVPGNLNQEQFAAFLQLLLNPHS